ncbi:ROK family protein [Niabella beijingensis]|uniref:ROK family protein n=1 Tax=Niabella beijingensis TaxID=2872700 RepID=UPI001CC0BC9A|nr:ROK family protein [Niabella beijingensis]MBZ4189893.1 ROK family protein [Niabella beijingensis]
MKEQFAIGIDVGGSALKCGVVAKDGTLVHCFTEALIKTKGEAGIIEQIAGCIGQAAAAVQLKDGAVCGAGIGFPGIVENNVVIGGADNLPGFEQLPLGYLLETQTGYPTVVDNDANMMGVGEWVYGAAKGCTDIVFLTVGTGIGGALIINNRLYGGYRNRGTELGHIIIRHQGASCSCGSRGCFEAYASVTALISHYQSLKQEAGEPVDGRQLIERYLQKEAAAVTAMEQHFDHMAAGIAGYINIFSPQKIVVGGGISEAGGFYMQEVTERVGQLAMPATSLQTTLVAAALGNKAGLQGCAATVFQQQAGYDPVTVYNHSTN